MMRREVVAVLTVCLICASSAWGANSIVVESKTFGVGVIDGEVRVFLENDVDIKAFVVPLVLREITSGAFPTALKLSYDDRLHPSLDVLSDLVMTSQHNEPTGLCGAGGFSSYQLFSDTLKHPVTTMPLGVMFARILIASPSLLAGSDTEGSMVLTMDLGSTTGSFEIDTTCTDPQNHIVIVATTTSQQITPAFTKGVITLEANTPPVAQCTDVTVPADESCAAAASIDAGSFDPESGAITLTQDPPGPYPIGVTNVRLTVTDGVGATDECFANVTVEDVTPPELVCHSDSIVVMEQAGAGTIVEFEALAPDACANTTFDYSPPSGSFFGIGITEVTCVATDDFGNSATCIFRIVVLNNSAYCNAKPADINCDGASDAVDLSTLIDHVFFGAPDPPSCCYGSPQ